MSEYIWATEAFDHATEAYPEECMFEDEDSK